jgi:hypothetical protein
MKNVYTFCDEEFQNGLYSVPFKFCRQKVLKIGPVKYDMCLTGI